ncbi:MAG: SH3 domain-containing protein [Betaproteobacteria bacterium]|nr:SH3 domain-containing protein [Betaproteobacteria bacterium]
MKRPVDRFLGVVAGPVAGLVLTALLAPAAWAQAVGATNRATELKSDPRADSPTVASLPRETPIVDLGRSSGWIRVQTGDKKTGWVRSFHVSMKGNISESSSGGGFLSGITGLFAPVRREQPKTISTVGIRGLSEEEMKNAKPNPAEFNKMKSYAVSKADAQAAAQRARLNPQTVAYVDANGNPVQGGGK